MTDDAPDRRVPRPRDVRMRTAPAENDRSSIVRKLGFVASGVVVLLGGTVYTADSYGALEAGGLVLLGVLIGAISFPYFVFRDDEREFYVVNTGDHTATFGVTFSATDGSERIHHDVTLAPGDGDVRSGRFADGQSYTVSVAVDGETTATTDVVPVPSRASSDESTIFTVEVGSTTVRPARYAASDSRS
ncbi:hypothetical protein [Natronobacterium texcoconense]|uniref:Uncharacterized protein n=1 Tax=Natronobacterium texcoconense TaxID=1095778 RepID=A0A1H1HUW6_NATTX|nr:hypothetical protein [Natronobacterium texcoconense]SDR29109.1 hypothetical protein SAMN04489842_3062 [Natronobacterium texcoconense]